MEISRVLALAVYVRDELIRVGCEITNTFVNGMQRSPSSVSIDFYKDNIRYEMVLFDDRNLTVEVNCFIIIDKLPDVKKLTKDDTIVVSDSEFVLNRHTYIIAAFDESEHYNTSFLIKPLVNDILKISEI